MRYACLFAVLAVAMAQPSAAQTWRDKVTAFAATNLQDELFYAHSRRD